MVLGFPSELSPFSPSCPTQFSTARGCLLGSILSLVLICSVQSLHRHGPQDTEGTHSNTWASLSGTHQPLSLYQAMAETLSLRATFKGHSDWVTAIACPIIDSDMIVSALRDKSIVAVVGKTEERVAMVYAFSIVSPRSSPSWLLGNAWSGVCCGYCRSSYRVSMLFLARLSSEDTETSKTSKWVANSSTRGQNPNGFLPAEDVDYLIKLSLGSVAGAAAIKYGSVVLPGFTRPNLVEAFSIIGLPVIIAVALLAAASLQKRDNNKP